MIPVLLSLLAGLAPALPLPAVQDEPAATIDQEELEALTEEIRREVEEIRGLEFLRPVSVAVTDREGLIEYAERQLGRTTSPEEMAAVGLAARLLGLLPPDVDYAEALFELLESQVGGFYDPSADSFYLMDRFHGDLARIILAHELTHALDDQHFDFDAVIEERKDDTDALFAFQAVAEGSGTAVMNRWVAQNLGEIDPAALAEHGDLGMEALAEAPPFLWKPLLAAYLRGAAFLNRSENVLAGQMRSPDMDRVNRAFRDPPRSSEEILHPAKYWDEEERDPPRDVALDRASVPDGWRVLESDRLGEIGLALVVAPLESRKGLSNPMAVLGVEYTSPAAEGWAGDRFALLASGEARALVCSTAWDTDEDAAEFLSAVRGLAGHLGEAALETARAEGLSDSASLARRGSAPRSVVVAAAIGLGAGELADLVDALRFRVEEPPPPTGG